MASIVLFHCSNRQERKVSPRLKAQQLICYTVLALEILAVLSLLSVAVLAFKGKFAVFPGATITFTVLAATYGSLLLAYGLYRGIIYETQKAKDFPKRREGPLLIEDVSITED